MDTRLEDLTKEQLIAELNVAIEKNKYLRDRVDQFEEAEKKEEFERRLAEATDFLKANGYGVYQEPHNIDEERLFVRTTPNTSGGPKPEDADNSIFCVDMSKPHLQAPWTISGGSGIQIHIADPTAKIIQNGKHIKYDDDQMEMFALYFKYAPKGETVVPCFEKFKKNLKL